MAKKNMKSKKKVAYKKVDESAEIINFLKSISQKNYSEANKYLQNVIDSKIKSKIGVALKEKLF